MASVSAEGVDETIRALDRWGDRIDAAARAAAEEAMEVLLTEMKNRTPVDEGTLRGTLHVVPPVWRGQRLEGAWVAGGPAADYAVIQHENEGLRHTVGQAKFMSSVTDERGGEVSEAIEDTLRDLLR